MGSTGRPMSSTGGPMVLEALWVETGGPIGRSGSPMGMHSRHYE